MQRLYLLLLLLASPAWAAMEFDGSTESAEGTPPLNAPSLTMCCWGKSDSATAAQYAMSIDLEAANTDRFSLQWRGDLAGDPIGGEAYDDPTVARAESTAGFTTGTWQHGCYTDLSGGSSRAAFRDGANKGTNTTNSTPDSPDNFQIGAAMVAGTPAAFFDGSLAECGLWNIVLNDSEIAALGKGFAPPCVRRASLVAYYPMVRDATSLKDRFGATADNLTLTGGTVSDHPRILNCQ